MNFTPPISISSTMLKAEIIGLYILCIWSAILLLISIYITFENSQKQPFHFKIVFSPTTLCRGVHLALTAVAE